MDIIITLFYILFSVCVVYPPTEFVTAGFTIPQLFENYLGSESMNFVKYHMKKMTITSLIHASLPLGYMFSLWFGGVRAPWMLSITAGTAILPLLMCYRIVNWWEYEKSKHPVVKALQPYVTAGSDWRVVAANVNTEFRSIDKVSIQLTNTCKLIATSTWLIRVTQYNINIVKQADCTLVATATDSHDLSTSGENEVQYLNVEVIPSRSDISNFTFRITTTALRDLNPRLEHPVRVPEHISLIPTLIEKFVTVFKEHVDQNPTHYVDEELEQCIGCLQVDANVKLIRRCIAPPVPEGDVPDTPQCQDCNCRVLWCCSCLARWWAARETRAGTTPAAWLSARGSCPFCRANFCLLDVCPVLRRNTVDI